MSKGPGHSKAILEAHLLCGESVLGVKLVDASLKPCIDRGV